MPNPDTLFRELQTHDIDVYDNVPESQVPQLRTLAGVTVDKRLVANYRHLELNTRRPQLADVRVRRAIAQAIDWDRINATVYHGIDVRAVSDIVPDSWAAPQDSAAGSYDPAAARRLLDAAGWKAGDAGVPFAQRHSAGDHDFGDESNQATNRPKYRCSRTARRRHRSVDQELSGQLLFAQNGPLYGGRYDLSWSIDTNGPEADNAGNWSGALPAAARREHLVPQRPGDHANQRSRVAHVRPGAAQSALCA